MSKKEHEARFTSATSFRQEEEEEEEWKTSEASDWDDPLQTALLYKDWHSSTCGHAIPWNASRLVDLKRCPICHESVSLICDGGQPQFQFQSQSQSNDGSSSTHPFVLFKFGKQTYRLSLQRPNPTVLAYERSSPIKTKTTQLAAFLNQWTMWSSSQSSTTATATATPCTAQERIQTALQLGDGFKILHKGKVLLPSNSVHHQTAEAISDQLADVSMKDEGDSGVRRTKIAKAGSGRGGGGGTTPTPTPATTTTTTTTKVSLVLMGTLQGRELQEPSSSAVASSLYSFTWIQLLQLPLAIFFWSLHSTWIFAKSFLEPFLPSSLIVGRGREDQQAPMDDLHRD